MHFAEVYGASVSKVRSPLKITDQVLEEMERLDEPAAG